MFSNIKTSKPAYQVLSKNQKTPFPEIKWSNSFQLSKPQWEQIYSLPCSLTTDPKILWFQYRLQNIILPTDLYLTKINIKQNPK